MTRTQKPQAKPRITQRSRNVFLAELAATCNVTASAAKAGRPRASFYRLRSADERFAEQWREALAEAVDRLEAEAYRIATEGIAERTYDADGNLVSRRVREDPRLVQFLLAAHRPGVYSERHRVELNGQMGVDHGFDGEAFARFTDTIDRLARRPTGITDVFELALQLGVADGIVQKLRDSHQFRDAEREEPVEAEPLTELEFPRALPPGEPVEEAS